MLQAPIFFLHSSIQNESSSVVHNRGPWYIKKVGTGPWMKKYLFWSWMWTKILGNPSKKLNNFWKLKKFWWRPFFFWRSPELDKKNWLKIVWCCFLPPKQGPRLFGATISAPPILAPDLFVADPFWCGPFRHQLGAHLFFFLEIHYTKKGRKKIFFSVFLFRTTHFFKQSRPQNNRDQQL